MGSMEQLSRRIIPYFPDLKVNGTHDNGDITLGYQPLISRRLQALCNRKIKLLYIVYWETTLNKSPVFLSTGKQ